MPARLNSRQESFAQHVAQGCTGREAYQKAGYAVSDLVADANASRLLSNARVSERVAELQARHASRAEVTVDELVSKLERLYDLALENRQSSAGVQAVMGIGKLLGLIIDRSEAETTLRKPAREPTNHRQMTLEEWIRKFAPQHMDPGPT